MACRFYHQRQWGSGLARRVIMATTAVAIHPLVVVSVATVAAVATVGRARRCEEWWPGCRGRSVGVERCWGSQMTYTIRVDLLQ
jgi:hypothetical protein